MSHGRADGGACLPIAQENTALPDNTARPAAPACLFCGEPERVAIFEIWGHEFMLETCCEGLHEQIAFDLVDDPTWARDFMRHLDIEGLSGHELRRVADDGGCGLLLDWALKIGPLDRARARAFISRHHAHCDRAPVSWRFGASIWNGRTFLGLAIVGNPVARALNGCGIVEVNRLCIRRDTAPALRWNAASMLYGWCAREAARQGWRKIITYTRIDEPGTSLRAAGWTPDKRVRGRGWHSSRRNRSNCNAWIDKIRWGRTLAADQRRAPQTAESQKGAWTCAASTSTERMMGASAFECAPAFVETRPGSSATVTQPLPSRKDRWDDAAWSWTRP